MRNMYAHEVVPPAAVRAISGAPVATPLTWKDLEANRSSLDDASRRLASLGEKR